MRYLTTALVLWACATPAHANVKLAPIFGDNMVLQREMPVPVWGSAAPGEAVTVAFAGQTKATKADDKGNWQVKLDALKAGGPFELVVTGANKLTLANVLVGEVWVCAGQSNMQWALKQTEKADEEIAQSANDKLRLNSGKWQPAGPESSGPFSGTGYYFGKALQKALGVPVGLVNRSVGGTSARAWTSKTAILEEPAMKPYVESILGKDAKGNAGNLYAGLIRPLQPMAIRGVIWYQGESDASRPQEYAELIQTMIRSWRKDWGQGDFPFLYVHLGAIGGAPKTPMDVGWGPIREAQDAALKLPNTGVAEFFDSDADLHPRKKKLAGDRLALAARALAYGEKIVHSGPVLDKVEKAGDTLVVHFKSIGSGLVSKGDPIKGFAIAGKDGQFHWADGKIEGDTVRLTSKAVAAPEFVRYGFASNPRATLYNREDLPALPFRTDRLSAPPPAKKAAAKEIIGTIERLDPRFDQLIPKDAQLEKIADGYIWTEGAVWYKPGKCLLFSDIPNNVVIKWEPGKGAGVFLKPAGYTGAKPRGGKPGDEPGSNGLAVDAQGRLYLCEHGDRRVTRIEKDGKKTVLADNYLGKKLNSPNDLALHPNGDVYFTDPPYGLAKGDKRELDFTGVYRINAKDGSITLVSKTLSPNGIALSPDAKKLYVTNGGAWMVFPVNDDGSTGDGNVFVTIKQWKLTPAKGGGVDGLKCDADGNIFATGPGGVCVIAPDGTLLGRLLTGDRTANLCFGGDDGRTLFVCVNHRIGMVRTTTKGIGW